MNILTSCAPAIEADTRPPVTTVRSAAADLIARGYAVCAVDPSTKRASGTGWSTRSAAPEDYGAGDMIGIVCGPLSAPGLAGHALVAIDLDSADAVRLADAYLPPTAMSEGRAGKPRSHRYYMVPVTSIPAADHSTASQAAPAAVAVTGHPGPRTRSYRDADGREVVRLVGTGGMVVCPPSAHPSGELREWVGGAPGDPAVVDYPDLMAAVRALAVAAGAVVPDDTPRPAVDAVPIPTDLDPASVNGRAVAYLSAVPPAVSGCGGHERTYAAATALVHGFALDPATAAALLMRYYSPRCAPPWSVDEIRHKVDSAGAATDHRKPRGHLLTALPTDPADTGTDGAPADGPPAPVPATGADPDGAPVDNPHRLARGYLSRDGDPMRYWRGTWTMYDRGAYRPLTDDELQANVAGWIDDEFARDHPRAVAAWAADPKGARPTVRPVTRALTENVLLAMRSLCLVPSSVDQPTWLDGATGPDPARVVSVANGLLDLDGAADGRPDALRPPSVSYFTPTVLPFEYAPNAPAPVRWMRFLREVWPSDPESIDTIQEWMGYLLSGATDQQKILMMIGPPRSGKGTIARVIRGLLGERNVAGPTLDTFSGRWGLSGLVGMTAAIISDARVGSRIDSGALTERLLSISGEDVLDVEKKGRDLVPMRLPTRLMIASNVLPRFADASPALAGRMIVLRFRESFAGREDTGLTAALLAELPGILLWALDGWRRLAARGRFGQPASGRDMVDDLADLASPVGAFLRERCDLGTGYSIAAADLYGAWCDWCTANGRRDPGTAQLFGRDLRAAADIEDVRPRTGDRRVRCYVGVRLRRADAPDTRPAAVIDDADLVTALRAHLKTTGRPDDRSDSVLLADLRYQMIARGSR